MEQLKIEFPKVQRKSTTRYYKDLNIHERINVKANSLQFANNYIRQLKRGFDSVHAITRHEHPEGIQWDRLIWHQKHNLCSIETIVWLNKLKMIIN